MHCSIPTLNIALVFMLMIHGDLTSSKLLRKKSLAIGKYINTIPSLRRIIYQAKMTACPMQIFKKGKLGIVNTSHNDDRNNTAITCCFFSQSIAA